MSEKVSLQEVANNAASRAMRNLYTCAPAKVVKWDSSKQRANCQILIKRVDKDEEDEDVVSSYPVVPGVPVMFIGAGGFRLTCPIKDGPQGSETTGLLMFSHLSLDKWLTGSGAEVDPEHAHDHALGDAIFLPGLKPFGDPWSSAPDFMSIGNDGDTGLQIRISADTVILAATEANAQFVALAQKVADELEKIKTAHNTHVHVLTISAQSGAGGTGTAAAPVVTYTPASVAATKVKAE